MDGKKSIYIDVDPDTTVLHLKNKVFDRTAFAVHSFNLTLGRFAVQDKDTLISLALKYDTTDFVFKINQQGPQGGMLGKYGSPRSGRKKSPSNNAQLAAVFAAAAVALDPAQSPSSNTPSKTKKAQRTTRSQVRGEQTPVGDEQHSEAEFSGPESEDDFGDELVREEKMVRVLGGRRVRGYPGGGYRIG